MPSTLHIPSLCVLCPMFHCFAFVASSMLFSVLRGFDVSFIGYLMLPFLLLHMFDVSILWCCHFLRL